MIHPADQPPRVQHPDSGAICAEFGRASPAAPVLGGGRMKLFPKLALGALVLFLLIQVVRPAKTNPPVTGELVAPPQVQSILRRACYDCHSHETRWPWYADVAPVSWLITWHVADGRKHLNFSTWSAYEPKRQAHKLEEAEEMVASGEMPMAGYVALHPEAKLTEVEKQALLAWAKRRGAPETPEPAPTPDDAPAPDAPPAP